LNQTEPIIIPEKKGGPIEQLRPEFKLIHYSDGLSNGLAQVIIDGDDEIWFDQSAIPKTQAERYLLLVEAAYDLGIEHTKKAIANLV
jgi:hypothetical protein